MFLCAALFGALAFPLYALCVAHMNDFVEADGYVEASSGLLLIYSGGAVLGPIIAAIAMEFLGPQGLFVFTASVHVLLASFVVYRMRQRESPPEEHQATFQESAVLAQTVSDIDPLDQEAETATAVADEPEAAAEDAPA